MESTKEGKDVEGTEPLTSEEIQWFRAFREEWAEYKEYRAMSVKRDLEFRRRIHSPAMRKIRAQGSA